MHRELLAWLEEGGQAKVYHLHVQVIIKQQVLSFKVTVSDMMLVTV